MPGDFDSSMDDWFQNHPVAGGATGTNMGGPAPELPPEGPNDDILRAPNTPMQNIERGAIKGVANVADAAGGLVQNTMGAAGKLLGGVGQVYDAMGAPTRAVASGLQKAAGPLAPNYEKGVEDLQNTPKSFLSWFSDKINALGSQPLKYLATGGEGNVTSGQPAWEDIIKPLMQKIPYLTEEEKGKTAANVGSIMEPTVNAANFLFPFGKTAAGVKAAKAGEEASTMGEAANLGHESLLTAKFPGMDPINLVPQAINKPVMNAMSGAYKAIKGVPGVGDVIKGFSTKTGDTKFDSAMDDWLQKNSAAVEQFKGAGGQAEQDKALIERHAALQGKTPEQLRSDLNEIFEPKGSQAPIGPPLPPGYREKSLEGMNAELSDWIKGKMESGKSMLQTPAEQLNGVAENEAYLPHDRHPQLTAWENAHNSKEVTAGGGSPTNKSVVTSATPREVGKTVKEANELGMAGRIQEIPQFANPKFKDYKGPVFSEKTEDLWANRQLESAKANNRHEFMDKVGNTVGTDKSLQDEMIANKQRDAHDYVEIKEPQWVTKDNPTGIKAFPKEIGEMMKNVDKPEVLGPLTKNAEMLNRVFKDLNFGVFIPPALTKIFIGNQFLAASKGLWNPVGIAREVGTEMKRLFNLNLDGKAVHAKALGRDLSEQEVVNLFKQHGSGMGYARDMMTEGDKKIYDEYTQSARKMFQSKKMPPFVKKALKVAGLPLQATAATIRYIADIGYGIHNISENITRRSTFKEALRQGYTPQAAGKVTGETLYNYSRLGPYAQQMRHFDPFFTFFFKNQQAMLKNVIKKPGMMAMPGTISNEMWRRSGLTKEDQDNIQDCDKRSLSFPIRTDNGFIMVNPGRYVPQVEANETLGMGSNAKEIAGNTPKAMIQSAYSLVNPVMRAPFDLSLANKDQFRDQPIEEMPGFKALTPAGPMDAGAAYLLNALRPSSEILRNQNPNIPGGFKALRAITGLNVKPYDPDTQAYNKMVSNDIEAGKMKTLSGKYRNAAVKHSGTAQGEVDEQNMDTAMDNWLKIKSGGR